MGWWNRVTGREVNEKDFIEFQNDLAQDIEQIEADIAELRTEMHSTRVEMWDYIDGTLQPLNKRLSSRIQREKEKNINYDNPVKSKGMLTSEDIQRLKHGFHQQS